MTIRLHMAALLDESAIDPALITDVQVRVEPFVDSFGLKQQRYVAVGKYDGDPFYARLGKTRYGQPQWKFFKPGTDERAHVKKKLRKAISDSLKQHLPR